MSSHASNDVSLKRTAALALGAIGVVYGDIGTSPLYTMKEVFFNKAHSIALTEANVLGLLSLIFWVLLLMAIMSWVSQGRSPVEYVLMQLADPLLRPIRNLLPSMGGIDFSPMVLVLLLYVINMGIAEVLQATGNVLLPGLWMAL